MKFKRLRSLRKENKLTQNDVAKFLHVSRATYTIWENGEETIPLNKLIKLNEFYKINIDYLTNLSNKKNYINHNSINLKDVSKNLKKTRLSMNLKQVDVAKKIKITPACLCQYENGITLISTKAIYKFAKAYNCSIDKLLKKQD